MYYSFTTEYFLISWKDRNHIFNKKTKGLGGKQISYPGWKEAELRPFKVIIPVGENTTSFSSWFKDFIYYSVRTKT